MEGGTCKEKLKKGEKHYLLYAMVLIFVLSSDCVIGPFAACVKCFLRAQRLALTLDF